MNAPSLNASTAPVGERGSPAAALAARAARPAGERSRRVVDAPTRVSHALLALTFTGAYLTAEGEAWRALHFALGYAMLGVLVFRVVYGLVGPQAARLSLLATKFAGIGSWLREAWGGLKTLQWPAGWVRQGQSHVITASVVALFALILPVTLAGIGADQGWLEGWIGDGFAELHEAFGEAMLMVVLAHVAAVIGVSLLRRRNLAAPMWHGRMPGRGPDLVKSNQWGWALLLVAGVVAWGVYAWRDAPNGLLPQPGAGSQEEDDDHARAPADTTVLRVAQRKAAATDGTAAPSSAAEATRMV